MGAVDRPDRMATIVTTRVATVAAIFLAVISGLTTADSLSTSDMELISEGGGILAEADVEAGVENKKESPLVTSLPSALDALGDALGEDLLPNDGQKEGSVKDPAFKNVKGGQDPLFPPGTRDPAFVV